MRIEEILEAVANGKSREDLINTRLSDNPFKQFALDINKLDTSQLERLRNTVLALAGWYYGDYVGIEDFGKIIEESNGDNYYFSVINLMNYFTKFCTPDVITGFTDLFRIQHLKNVHDAGDEITVKPFRSVTSWSIYNDPNIVNRETTSNDYVIKTDASSQRVIWSYKFQNYRRPMIELRKVLDELSSLDFRANKVKRSDLLGAISDRLDQVMLAITEFDMEKEVILYNGGKPFSATVIGKT